MKIVNRNPNNNKPGSYDKRVCLLFSLYSKRMQHSTVQYFAKQHSMGCVFPPLPQQIANDYIY